MRIPAGTVPPIKNPPEILPAIANCSAMLPPTMKYPGTLPPPYSPGTGGSPPGGGGGGDTGGAHVVLRVRFPVLTAPTTCPTRAESADRAD